MACTTKCTYMHIIHYTVKCAAGVETRLVGGSTEREGRVEVCMGGRRWRTVCTGSQDLAVLARGVCLRIGIESLVLEGDHHNYNYISHLIVITTNSSLVLEDDDHNYNYIPTDSTTIYTQEALWQ